MSCNFSPTIIGPYIVNLLINISKMLYAHICNITKTQNFHDNAILVMHYLYPQSKQ